MTTLTDVVTAARTWIGTPYQHQQRIKGVAVDCAGLVIGVARELNLVTENFDITGYSPVPDGTSLVLNCEDYMTEVPKQNMRPGHIIVVKFDSEPQHFGILSDYIHGRLAIIHATSRYMKVIETRLLFSESPSGMKFVSAYCLPGVA